MLSGDMSQQSFHVHRSPCRLSMYVWRVFLTFSGGLVLFRTLQVVNLSAVCQLPGAASLQQVKVSLSSLLPIKLRNY